MQTVYRLALLSLLAGIAASGSWAQPPKPAKPSEKKDQDEKKWGELPDLPAPILFPAECEPPNGTPGPQDPKRAIVLIRMQNSQCSATFVKPRLKSGKWHILTANHCLQKGQRCTVRLDDGRMISATAVASEKASDICWLQTDVVLGPDLPALELDTGNPSSGTKVWHQGFGVDKPRNREEGYAQTPIDQNGQTRYWLSVSPGDSGGGIVRVDNNKLLSPVCCTTRLAGPGWVWAGAPTRCWQLRPGADKPAEIMDARIPVRGPAPGHPRTTIIPVLILSGEHGLDANHR